MTGCTDPELHELLGAYALGACPDDEADRVRAHLETCSPCRGELLELSVARDALLTDVPPRAPSPELKAQIMDRVRAESELFGAATPRRAPVAAPRRRGWLGGRMLATAATLLIALVAGIAALSGGGDTPSVRTIDAQIDTRQAPGGSAQVIVDRDGHARLVVRGMPDPGRGRVYEVWLRDGGGDPRPTSALFSVDRSGAGETSVPGGIDRVDQVLVTSEPAGGSTSPSRVPLVVATV